MPRRKVAPIHPGEILKEEFLGPLGLSQDRLARDTGCLPAGSTRSSEEPGRSPPIRRSGSAVISAPWSDSGWTCRRTTTSKSRRIGSAIA